MAKGAREENASNDYAAGVMAGVATVLVGHPFDTIKVRGFYRGATPSFIGTSVESALLFGSYSQIKTSLQAGDVNPPLLSTVVPAAACSGAGVSLILCPTELVKCRLQVHAKGTTGGAQKYDGPLDCIRKTIQTEGVQGLFRGLTTTFVREAVGNAFFFVTYEITRHRMLTSMGLDSARSGSVGDKVDSLEELERHFPRSSFANYLIEAGVGILSGGLSGIAFWTVVLPMDVAKTRIQTAQDLNASRNPLVHLRMIYKNLGVRGLYAGLSPTLIRAFPANAAAISVWELTAQFLARHQ